MNGGDPASLSLPIRRKVLEGLVSRLVADPDLHPIYDHDKLRRFTTSELSELVRVIWFSQRSTSSVRSLLLMMIWLGRLVSCVDLALNAALTVDGERMEQLFGARAVTTVGDEASRGQLADHIRRHAVRLPPLVVWDALEHLFPAHLTIDDLLIVLDCVPQEMGYGFRFDGPKFATKLNSVDQLTFFIEAILVRVRRIVEPAGTLELKGVVGLFGPTLAVAAMRLMKRSPDDQAPTAAIDAYLWLNKDRYAQRARETEELSLKDELCRTSIRRRTTFWRAAERLNGPSLYDSQPMNNYLLLEFYGWPGGLELNDLDWLLQDMLLRGSEDDHQLALSAAHWVWQNNKSDPKILTQISSAAQHDPNLKKLHELWVSPRAQDHEIQRFIAESAAQKAQHEAEQAKRDASWWQFIEEMRADTAEIRAIRPRADNTVDGRLYNLWKLARSACAKDSKFEFDSLAAIQPVLGAGLTEALNHALVAFWRSRRPVLRSDRPPGERNLISDLDSMAISAISLEASGNSSWAVSLTFDDAALAAQFATLELNGFPTWLGGLANEQPSAVASVLVREVFKRLDETESTWLDVLERLTRADLPIVRAVGPGLLNALDARPDISGSILRDILEVIIRGLRSEQVFYLRDIALNRAASSRDLSVSGTYFAAAFACDPTATIDRLVYRLDHLSPIDQTTLATAFLPKLFGEDILRDTQITYTLPFIVLTRLVLIAYQTIRVHEDLNRPSFEVYSPTARDTAEGARAAAFDQLIETPGRETYDILLQLAETKDFPIPPRRLRELARRRAFMDADGQAWAPDEVLSFETEFERPPTTAFELQQLLLLRLEDLNHELLHGDFNLGRTFKLLPDETAVQNWVARELRMVQRNSYGVDREVHRAFEKEPDIVVRAKASDASVAVEIKVADGMSIKALETALSSQLCERYLRARDGRHGILLLVYQHAKADGWRDQKSGKLINFDSVLAHLQTIARQIASGQGDAPQPVVAVLNTASLLC